MNAKKIAKSTVLSILLASAFCIAGFAQTANAQVDFNDPIGFSDFGGFGSGVDYNNPTYFGDLGSNGGYGVASGVDFNNPSYFSDLGSNGGYGVASGETRVPEYATTPGYWTQPEYSVTPGYTTQAEYSVTPGYTTQAEYSTETPYYSAPCDCYSSSPLSSVPSYAAQYIPSYAQSAIYAATYAPPRTTTSAPINNTNTNTNTNVNTPTAVATATNGPITNTNTFNPVINVGSGESTTHVVHDYQYTYPQPYCTIYASNSYNNGYNYNQPITLTWNSRNASRGYISPNVGNVSANGSQTVYPNGYTTYTMTVYGQGGNATCQTTANYASSYVPPAPVYTAAPATPYVSLSQIPYTGFDYGPWGNAMYWAALLAFAAAAGYLLVYFMPGRRNFAFANFSGGRKNNAFENQDLQTVFQSNLVPVAALEVSTQEVSPVASILPTIEAHRLTTDSMIVDRSSDAPRIVIARN